MAKKKPKKKEPLPNGRPTKYNRAYNVQAYKLCLLGAIDQELADFFEVDEGTLNNWKNKHPTFKAAIKKGKLTADAEVANALYERAIGYEHDDVHISVYEGTPIITPIKKKYAPDTKAALSWLQIRQLNKWKEEKHLNLTGELSMSLIQLFEEIDGQSADIPTDQE